MIEPTDDDQVFETTRYKQLAVLEKSDIAGP